MEPTTVINVAEKVIQTPGLFPVLMFFGALYGIWYLYTDIRKERLERERRFNESPWHSLKLWKIIQRHSNKSFKQ